MRDYQTILTPYIGKFAHMSFMPNAVIDLDFSRKGDLQLMATESSFVILRDSTKKTLLLPYSALIIRLPAQ